MSNGDTLDSITAILCGDEPIPERVSNRLIMVAIAQNYQQLNQEIESINKRLHEFIELQREICIDVDNLDTAIKLQMKDIEQVRRDSSKWDKILGLATAIGTAVGISFGSK